MKQITLREEQRAVEFMKRRSVKMKLNSRKKKKML